MAIASNLASSRRCSYNTAGYPAIIPPNTIVLRRWHKQQRTEVTAAFTYHLIAAKEVLRMTLHTQLTAFKPRTHAAHCCSKLGTHLYSADKILHQLTSS